MYRKREREIWARCQSIYSYVYIYLYQYVQVRIYIYVHVDRKKESEREREGEREREREIWAGKPDRARQLRDAICASLPPRERAAADARFPHICI